MILITRALSFFLLCSPLLLTGQTSDSLAVRQVDSLLQVSRTLIGQRNFSKALEINTIAEKIASENMGRMSPAYGNCCFLHGRVSYSAGDYAEAEKWLLDSKSIRETVLGKDHPDYAASLNSLASLSMEMGNYEKAERLFLESKTIREKALGKEHPDYAASLHNLGFLYRNMGEFEKSESLNLEAKAIREKVLGKKHPDYAKSLNNLAILYSDMGDYEKAELYFLESKNIKEKALGKEHPEYANALNNLAVLYRYTGEYKKAEPLFLEALSIQEKLSGKEHPNYATNLNNLALLYFHVGDYEKAEPFFLDAKAIREKTLGKEHSDYAMSLNNLAGFYEEVGNYARAETLFLEAKAIWGKALGKEHSRYIENLNGLAALYWETGAQAAAASCMAEGAQLNQVLITRGVHHLSERELNSYLKTFLASQAQVLSFAQISARNDLAQTSFNNSLFYKGFLLNIAQRLKRMEYANPEASDNLSLLKSYERRLATEYAKPITERDSAKVAILNERANNLEKALARSVAGLSNTLRQVKWQEVKAALQPREAAIEFVSYPLSDPKPHDSTMYAALVLSPGSDQPRFIPLCEEKSLYSLLLAKGARQTDGINSLYSSAQRKPAGKAPQSLYDLLWRPLEKELSGVQTIYFSPSGLLHRLNMAAIPIHEDERLADRYQLVELGSTRQIVLPSEAKNMGQDALLWGGIQYDLDSTAFDNLEWRANTLAVRNRRLEFSQADSTLRGGTWNYLPWTEAEVKTLEPILSENGIQPVLQTGYAATEETFKAIGTNGHPSPRILHIATHGFFFPDPKTQEKGKEKDPKQARGGSREAVFKVSEQPMMRSGLVLAGGNHAWRKGRPARPDIEDGILTAYEISQLDLSHTELVVLSACETGLGDIQGNEGVYGLQRAFKIAGAKYLIMSLWQVPDYQTQQLMSSFYRFWLDEKMTIPDAFRAAQKSMRKKFKDPFFWAGFVLVE